jgi:hypothetical protein
LISVGLGDIADLASQKIVELGSKLVSAEQAAGANPLGLMFPAPAGGYWRSSNFRRRVLEDGYLAAGWRAADGAGRWTWHSLRHVFCTTALSGWHLEPADVSCMAGHATVRVTLDNIANGPVWIVSTKGNVDRARAVSVVDRLRLHRGFECLKVVLVIGGLIGDENDRPFHARQGLGNSAHQKVRHQTRVEAAWPHDDGVEVPDGFRDDRMNRDGRLEPDSLHEAAQRLPRVDFHLSTGHRPVAIFGAHRGVLDGHRPDIVFYLAGADPYEGDRLGRLKLSIEGLRTRDRLVFDACRERGVPVAVAMSGGYCPDVDAIVTIHINTIKEAVAA